MYKLTVKDTVYTIPKENIGLLAYVKAQDNGTSINPNDKEGAIEYLRKIGIEVSEDEN